MSRRRFVRRGVLSRSGGAGVGLAGASVPPGERPPQRMADGGEEDRGAEREEEDADPPMYRRLGRGQHETQADQHVGEHPISPERANQESAG